MKKMSFIVYVLGLILSNSDLRANWLDVMNSNNEQDSAIRECPKFQAMQSKRQNLKNRIKTEEAKIQNLKDKLVKLEEKAKSETATSCKCKKN